MPRKKKSKLTRILDAIEKTLVQHAKQVVHEDNKKKSPTRKKKTTKKERPIDFQEMMMTKEQKDYYENKYQTFIRVWQTSDSINEVKIRLSEQHNWSINMEVGYRMRPLNLTTVRAYARRIRERGVFLKVLPMGVEPKVVENHPVDYDALNSYAESLVSK